MPARKKGGRGGEREAAGRRATDGPQSRNASMLQMNRKVSIGGATRQRRGGKKRCQRPGNPVTY